jgi:MSHA biogenesis protein MshJ
MKALWDRCASWVDDHGLEQRGAIFAGLLLVLGAFFYLLALEPAASAQRAAESQLETDMATIRKLEKEITRTAGTTVKDPDAENRIRMKRLTDETREVELAIEANKNDLVSPEQIASMLEAVLNRQSGLRLVSLAKLPVRGLDGFDAAPAAPSVPTQQQLAPQSTSPDQLVFMQGMQITVEGSYQNLVGYVQQLESLPIRLVWGNMSLAAREYPTSALTLEVYTLSLEKKWLNL